MCKLFAPAAPIIAEKLYKTLTGGYSVHLENWADIPENFRDDKLLDEVKLVRSVIYLARSIRSKNNVKNRQPLSELCVALSDSEGNAVVESFKDIIAEELNVKEVKILESAESVAEIKYAPNFNEIRNRYPDRIPDIIKAVKSGKFKLGEKAVLNINGTDEEFDAEVILVTYQAKAGQHVASDKGIVVSLDLTITDELRDEGFARDIVRSIQDARRKLGCAITDRISMKLTGDVPASWVDYICGETLSDNRDFADADTSYEVEYEDGRKVTVALKK